MENVSKIFKSNNEKYIEGVLTILESGICTNKKYS